MEIVRSALVVVDLQNGFVTDASAHIVTRIAALAQRWVSSGGALILSRYQNFPGSQFERLLGWTDVRTPPDTDLVPEIAALAPAAHAVIDKTIYSVFTEDGTNILAKGGFTDLVFCGLDTDTCVLKSAVDAFERDYTPWLLRDACASHGGRGHHRSALTQAGRFIGINQIIRTADLKTVLQPRR